MGTRITDLENVALYDSTTGVAFGPVFEREDEAQAFLTWLEEGGDGDPRAIQPEHLMDVYERFSETREDQ